MCNAGGSTDIINNSSASDIKDENQYVTFKSSSMANEKSSLKMKLIIALCLLVVVAAAPPKVIYSNDNVQILRYNYDFEDNGYNYGFEQTDGTKIEEKAVIRNGGSENEYIAKTGSYSWVGPDGVTYTVTYVADENGFQPEIQQGPGGAVPAAVAASILG